MVSLERLATANPWWSKGVEFAYQDEKLANVLNAENFTVERREIDLKPNNVYVIKGPRLVGKTTWLKIFVKSLLEKQAAQKEDILYFSFDEVKSSRELSNMLNSFLGNPHSGRTYLLLDELQNVENFGSVLKNLYDTGKLRNVVTVITGSLAHTLYEPGRGSEGNVYYMRTATFNAFVQGMLHDVETRHGVNRLNQLLGYTFSNKEAESLLALLEEGIDIESDIKKIYAKANEAGPYIVPLNKLFYIYLRTGGYPDALNRYVRNLRGGKPERIDNEIYARILNYLKTDAAMLAGKGAGDTAIATRVLDSVLGHVGMKVSYAKMAREMDANNVTFTRYISRLEDSFAFIILNGLDESLKKRETKKLYFSDVFMHYSIGAAESGKSGSVFSEESLNSTMIGSLVEEAAISNLMQIKEEDQMREYGTYLGFYHSQSGKEIDFIYVRNNGSAVGIEVKYQAGINLKSDLKRISAITEYIIMSRDEIGLYGQTAVVPACILLALVKKSPHNL
jgi:predicted AAA+ superfamily ATPase